MSNRNYCFALKISENKYTLKRKLPDAIVIFEKVEENKEKKREYIYVMTNSTLTRSGSDDVGDGDDDQC